MSDIPEYQNFTFCRGVNTSPLHIYHNSLSKQSESHWSESSLTIFNHEQNYNYWFVLPNCNHRLTYYLSIRTRIEVVTWLVTECRGGPWVYRQVFSFGSGYCFNSVTFIPKCILWFMLLIVMRILLFYKFSVSNIFILFFSIFSR